MGSSSGRIAYVTGGMGGIGTAICRRLARQGYTVIAGCGPGSTRKERWLAEMRAEGWNVHASEGNVSDWDSTKRAFEVARAEVGPIDILINNAGITRDRTMRKMSAKEWRDVLNTNLNGTFYCTRAALPSMIERKFGRIVNIASFVGQCGAYGQANYAASKGAVIAFTKTVALEMAQFNITANVVAPGYTATDMVAGIPSRVLREIESRIPLGRLAEPQEIAKATAFLVTDGDYITGHELNVNGGVHM